MIVIAIDPGPETSGYVEASFRGTTLLNIRIAASEHPNAEILQSLRFRPGELRNPNVIVACEWIANMGMPAGESLFTTARYVGRFEQAAKAAGITDDRFLLLKRTDIKLAICGSARAKDANVRQALLDLYPKGRKRDPGLTYRVGGHAWQALAVAVVAARQFSRFGPQS